MNTVDEDLALKTLLEVRLTEAPSLDPELLRLCFLIQKRFQFNPDPTFPATQMEDLIDRRVDESTNKKDA